SGPCWLRGRSPCAKSTVGRPSTKRLPIRSLTSPHDQLTSPCWRLRESKFQPKSRQHLYRSERATPEKPEMLGTHFLLPPGGAREIKEPGVEILDNGIYRIGPCDL